MKQLSKLFNTCADQLVLFSRRFGRKAWIASLLIFSFSLSIFTPPPAVSQAPMIDIQGHWAQLCIEQLSQRRIITGYPDGTFRPNAPITRAEFSALLSRAFPNAPVVRPQSVNFPDVPVVHWALPSIRRAYQTGFMVGYPDRQFRPSQQIPRVQVLVSLVSGLTASAPQELAAFSSEDATANLQRFLTDTNQIPVYARPAVATALANRLMVNYPNVRQFQPNRLASRGEVASFLCQALATPGTVPPQYVAGASNTPSSELRGVWLTNVDSDVLFSQRNTTEAIEQLHALNFNTLYPTVWNWGYTLYPSQVAKQVIGREIDPEEGLQGRDMLQEVVSEGHNQGMAVIPWFEFGFMAPADSELATRHPDWLTQRRDGNRIWMEGNVHSRVWLNPLHPEVQQFITNLIVEVVSNYEVDGIQVDDHFGFPSDFGYDDYTISLYRQEHSGRLPPANFQDEEWIRWRANKITDYMRTLFQAVKAQNPNVIMAVSPNPQEFSLESYLLDWETWERAGLVEELVLQVYRTNMQDFQRELAQPEVQAAKNHIPVGIGILSGLKGRAVPSERIVRQVQYARDQGFAGSSFFFYETLWNLTQEPATERQATFKGLFPQEVQRPTVLTS